MKPIRLFADAALLPEGWAERVLIEIGADGAIASVTPGGDAAGAERAAGQVLPAMPNLHSHAFQRAMAGHTERAGEGEDSFWTWRQVMYGFVARLDPDAAIIFSSATGASFGEMVLSTVPAEGQESVAAGFAALAPIQAAARFSPATPIASGPTFSIAAPSTICAKPTRLCCSSRAASTPPRRWPLPAPPSMPSPPTVAATSPIGSSRRSITA